MQENLVIVESPAKAKTIEKFLGKDYIVKSSFGHIRDLSKKDLGINIDDEFRPVYEIPGDKKKVVDELTKLAKSKTVWLASDEDREGEAIAWHLTEVLGLPVDQTKRIVFHEITKRAILEAIENPRTVNMDLVNAQQARRILDRLVGFELSPVLWKKVRPSLSAGRVQSVAVRLIVEREREIIAFRSAPYFRVVAQFYAANDPEKTLFKAELSSRFETQAEAEAFLRSCIGATFTVSKAEEKPAQRFPAPPFTTSTLQQEAGRKLGMSVSQTMSVAQHLYEQGLITYMRTDSVNLSQQALAQCKEEITKLYGEKYSSWHNYKTKTKGAQEAHEAIRPSYIDRQSIEGTPAEKKLYDLIWKRTVASQMVCAELDRTTIVIDMSGSSQQFVATGEVVRFDGFLRLYSESTDDDQAAESGEGLLPKMAQGDELLSTQITATERFTQAPARYNEASLVKRLEELGIAVERDKVLVDRFYRTNVPGVYAIGDIVGGPALAHVASAEGICCVEAICGLDPAPVDYSAIPSCVFTSPEVASVGMTEQQAQERGVAYKVGRFPFTASGKATAAGDRDGFVKLLFGEDDTLLGAHMVGQNVTEMIAEPTLARMLGATAHRIARTIHAHPTMNEGVMEAAEAALGEAIHL